MSVFGKKQTGIEEEKIENSQMLANWKWMEAGSEKSSSYFESIYSSAR